MGKGVGQDPGRHQTQSASLAADDVTLVSRLMPLPDPCLPSPI
jgi:hypothetical protein